MSLSDDMRRLKGKRIARVLLNPFPMEERRGTAYDPVIILDDGTRITFTVQETAGPEYGVKPNVHRPKKQGEQP